jgi:hypothetical protein
VLSDPEEAISRELGEKVRFDILPALACKNMSYVGEKNEKIGKQFQCALKARAMRTRSV